MTILMSTRQRIIFLLGLGFVLMMSMMSFRSGQGTTYWYVNNEPYEWTFQDDVYAFRLVKGKKYSAPVDPAVVDYLHHGGTTCSEFNFIYFNAQSTGLERDKVIQDVKNDADFYASYDVVTLFPHLDYDKGMWFVADELIMVNFDFAKVDNPWINDFASRYNLLMINNLSGLPAGGNYTYIYLMSETDVMTKGGINIAREIYEADSNLLVNVQPNLINAYEGKSDIDTFIEDNNPSGKAKFYVTNANNQTLQVFYSIPGRYNHKGIINVFDYYGHQVISKMVTTENGNETLDISDLPGGIYISNIQSENGEILSTQKFRVL